MQNRELVSVSFKKGFDKDISPESANLTVFTAFNQNASVCVQKVKQHMTAFNFVLPRSLFIYLRFYAASNTVQFISRRVVGRAEETST